MPAAPFRPCLHLGCAELVTAGRCAQHRRQHDRERGSAYRRGYDAAWQRLRALKLATNPFCEIRTHCASRPLAKQLASEVDHIIPVRERPDLRLAWDNLQSACKVCHRAKTALRDGGFGR